LNQADNSLHQLRVLPPVSPWREHPGNSAQHNDTFMVKDADLSVLLNNHFSRRKAGLPAALPAAAGKSVARSISALS